jgi:hypothetical protein
MRTRLIGTLALAATIFAAPALAQDHIVPRTALTGAVNAQTVTDAQNRKAITTVLERRDVRELAQRMGLDATTADRALATMSSSELARAATMANATTVDLAGGDVVVISVTTLLLLLILIILVVR